MCEGEQVSIHTAKIKPKTEYKTREMMQGRREIEADDVCVLGSMRCLYNRSCRGGDIRDKKKGDYCNRG